MGLISPTFYEQLLHTKISKAQSQSAIREKVQNLLSYKKRARKMLVKLTPGVNVTNILQAAFLFEFVNRM